LNPNDANALALISDFKPLIGKPQQGVQSAERAMRLNPHPPHWYYWNLGFAQFANGQYDDAARTLRREETYRTASRRILAAALAVLGRVSEAREEAKLFLSTSPHWRISKWVESQPFKNPKDAQPWIDAYRLAGLPE
jgi:tetratricopeptide (TPR) repeat protein